MEYSMTNKEVNLQKRRHYNGDCFVSGQNVKKINFIGTLLISQYLNESILLTEEKESQGAPFFRSSYYKKWIRLTTDLHYKPTDTYQ